MTRKELERKLEQLGCLDWYSLDGSLCSDRRILYENYSVWNISIWTKGEIGRL